MKHSTLVMSMYDPSPGRLFHMFQTAHSDTNLEHNDESSLKPEPRSSTCSSLETRHGPVYREDTEKKSYSDLHMYEAFYFGDENKETITGKTVSCFKPVNQS
jgi:hypothetical protein